MESKFAIFRQIVCLFLSFALALAPFQATAGYELNYVKLIKDSADTNVSIDGRDLEKYLEMGTDNTLRHSALLEWFEDKKAAKDFSEMLTQFWDKEPDTAKILSQANVNRYDIKVFFAETLLLMAMIKRNRPALVPKQYDFWKYAWEKVDFRYMTPETAKIWSEKLRSIFSLALSEAGPWGEEELKRVTAFFQSKLELNDKKWYTNFRNRLRRIAFDKYLNADPKIKQMTDKRALPAVFGGFPVGLAAGGVSAYYSAQLIDILHLNQLPSSIGAPLYIVWAISIGAIGVASWLGIVIGAQTTPLNFFRQRHSLSDILTAGPLDCELMLEKESTE